MPDAGRWKALTGVACGAFLGTEARYLLGLAFPETGEHLPWTTLCINIFGSLVLGYLSARWAARPARFWVRAAVGPGIIGSFTTFSSVMLALTTLTTGGAAPIAVAYLVLSLAIGLAAAAVGLALGRRNLFQEGRT